MSSKSAAKVISDIGKQWGEVLSGFGGPSLVAIAKDPSKAIEFLEKSLKHNEATTKMSKFWNKMVGNSWATLGPRDLELNQALKGTLQGTSGRTFITPHPLKDDKVTIIINERDGKAKTEVTIYKASPGRDPEEVRTLWFNDDKKDKKDESEDKSVKLSGLKGYLLMINLDAKSVANKFAYTLHVKT